MKSAKIYALVFVIILLFTGSVQAAEGPPDLDGQWYGTWAVTGAPSFTQNWSLVFQPSPVPDYDLVAIVYVPDLGLFDQPLPAMVERGPGGVVAVFIGIPGILEIQGALEGRTLSGSFYAVLDGEPPITYSGTWYLEKYPAPDVFPGPAPGPECDDLPPLYCTGDAEYCGELLPFEAASSLGDLDPPYVLQSDPAYRYIRRDMMMVVQYATAKVACKTADWGYGNKQPLGLVDMSEADGDTPGTDVGTLFHPEGSHEDGKDIDTAYFQLYAPDNYARPVGVHFDPVTYMDQYHLLEPPYALDKWRTALFVAYLSEHPRIRLIAVDGQIGPVLEDAIDELVELGWLAADARATMPLGYEVEDQGYLLYLFHHHHMHLSMVPGWDVVTSSEVTPSTLNRASQGKSITASFELREDLEVGQIDTSSIGLILDHTWLLYAEPEDVKVSDYNNNGVPDITAKFDRQQVLDLIGDEYVEISISGEVDGQFFEARDTVYVLVTPP